MADEPKGPGPIGDLFFIVGLILVLVLIWFASGGASRASVSGIFIHPPPPVGTGGSYGPTIGNNGSYIQGPDTANY
jgi:hypothetical protein